MSIIICFGIDECACGKGGGRSVYVLDSYLASFHINQIQSIFLYIMGIVVICGFEHKYLRCTNANPVTINFVIVSQMSL